MTVKEEPDERVLLIEELDSSRISAVQISHCIDRDPTLAHVREYLTRGWPDDKIDMNMAPYHCRRDELSVQGGCVLRGAKVVIPPQSRQEVLHELHLAHPGLSRMKSRSQLEEMVQKCDTCQLHNKAPPAAPLHPWEWPEKPWTRIHIDYAGPFLGKMFLVAINKCPAIHAV